MLTFGQWRERAVMSPGVSYRPLMLVLITFCLQVVHHVAAAAVPNATFVTACEENQNQCPEELTLGTTSYIFLDGDQLKHGNYSSCVCNFSSLNNISISVHRARGIRSVPTAGHSPEGSGTDPMDCSIATKCRWNDSNIQLLLIPCLSQEGHYIILKVQGGENSSIKVTCAKNSTRTVEGCRTTSAATDSTSTAQSSATTSSATLAASSSTAQAATGASNQTAAESDTATQRNASQSNTVSDAYGSPATSPGADLGPSIPTNASASHVRETTDLSEAAQIDPRNTAVLAAGVGLIAIAIIIVVVFVLKNRRRRRAGSDSQSEGELAKQEEAKSPRPGGKGRRPRSRPPGPSQPDPGGAAALHSSRASLISEQHDYEDVSEDDDDDEQQPQDDPPPPSRKASKDSARGPAPPIPGADEYSHFATSGSVPGPNYTNVTVVNIPTKGSVEDSNYNKLALRPALNQSGPSGKAATKAKASTLPQTSLPANRGHNVFGEGDSNPRGLIAHNDDGDIYENLAEGQEHTSGSRRRKPRKGEQQKDKGGAGDEAAEDMYQNFAGPKGGNRSLPRQGGGGSGGGGDSFRLSPRLSRAGSWRLSWRRRKGGQPDKTLADLDVRHLPLPRDPCGTDDDSIYEIEDGPFGHPLPPRLPPSVSRVTNLRRNSSRSMDNVSRTVLLKVARDATRRLGLNRPKSMDLSQLELTPDSARNSLHSCRSQGDGAETLPRVMNDLNDEDEYEVIPDLNPPLPAKSAVPGSRQLGAGSRGNATHSPASQTFNVPAVVLQAARDPDGPARTSPRSRTSSEPPKASPRPERAAARPREQVVEAAGEAEVVMRRASKAGSPTKVKVDKPPLPQDGKFSEEDQLKLLRINRDLLELQTAVRKSMEIHADELLMVDNVLYATLPRNSSQPTTEL